LKSGKDGYIILIVNPFNQFAHGKSPYTFWNWTAFW